jgi:hypothetical protein
VDELADGSVLAIDSGGTRIRAALIIPDRAVHARRVVATRDEDGVEPIVHDRTGDRASEGGSHRPQPAARAEQGAVRS